MTRTIISGSNESEFNLKISHTQQQTQSNSTSTAGHVTLCYPKITTELSFVWVGGGGAFSRVGFTINNLLGADVVANISNLYETFSYQSGC